MNLDEFVATTMQQIAAGVERARREIDPEAADREHTQWETRPVSFDVAVTVSASTEGQTGGGVHVAVFAVGAKVKGTDESSTVSRIQFSVPLILPKVFLTTKGGVSPADE